MTPTSPPLSRLVPEYAKRFTACIPSKPDDELKKLYGCARLFRLNNNENALGPPPAAQEVIRSFPAPHAAIYPSGDAFHLRVKLGERLRVHPDQILVGNGANEVIGFIIKAFCQEGDNIVTADRTFSVYEWVAELSGFEARLVPLKDFRFDDQGILERIDERTKVLFICNPNNPTGSYWSEARLRRFLEGVAGRQIVVVDEAYGEFVEDAQFPNSIPLLHEFPNLVVFRTFSKMYGLAGLRIGYLVGDQEAVAVMRRTCVVYSVNSLAQTAAYAALDQDREHIAKTRELVREGKDLLLREVRNLNLPLVSGEGNFMMIQLPINDGLAYRKLMRHGVMIRSMTGFRFPNWIRVTISQREAMEAFVEALRKILKE